MATKIYSSKQLKNDLKHQIYLNSEYGGLTSELKEEFEKKLEAIKISNIIIKKNYNFEIYVATIYEKLIVMLSKKGLPAWAFNDEVEVEIDMQEVDKFIYELNKYRFKKNDYRYENSMKMYEK